MTEKRAPCGLTQDEPPTAGEAIGGVLYLLLVLGLPLTLARCAS